MLAQARDEAGKARAALAAAPRGKGTEADLASLKSDSQSVDATLEDMQRAFEAGDFVGAKTKAQAAIDASKAREKEIDQARTAHRKA
jgi:uncharacterized membrane protein YgcG